MPPCTWLLSLQLTSSRGNSTGISVFEVSRCDNSHWYLGQGKLESSLEVKLGQRKLTGSTASHKDKMSVS